MSDAINPNHYKQGKVECIDAIEAAVGELKGLDAVCTANAIKYLWRWKLKNGVQDLRKASWYLNTLISLQETQKDEESLGDFDKLSKKECVLYIERLRKEISLLINENKKIEDGYEQNARLDRIERG